MIEISCIFLILLTFVGLGFVLHSAVDIIKPSLLDGFSWNEVFRENSNKLLFLLLYNFLFALYVFSIFDEHLGVEVDHFVAVSKALHFTISNMASNAGLSYNEHIIGFFEPILLFLHQFFNYVIVFELVIYYGINLKFIIDRLDSNNPPPNNGDPTEDDPSSGSNSKNSFSDSDIKELMSTVEEISKHTQKNNNLISEFEKLQSEVNEISEITQKNHKLNLEIQSRMSSFVESQYQMLVIGKELESFKKTLSETKKYFVDRINYSYLDFRVLDSRINETNQNIDNLRHEINELITAIKKIK